MNLLAIIKPAINVEQVVIQGRLSGADIAILISQMGIININSLFKMKQTMVQIIDLQQKQYVEALILFLKEYHTWGCNILKGNHRQDISEYDYPNRRKNIYG